MENIVLKTLSYGKKSTDKNYIEIIYGSDEKFARPVGISMSSVREHNPHCIFHWFVTKLDDADLNRVKRFSLESDVLCNIYYVNQKLVDAFPHNAAWSPAMYYRILAALYFKDKAKRLLYLDGDTYCRGDLSQLYNIDLHDNIIAAVRDVFPDQAAYNRRVQYIGHTGDGYFNSGVLLIDIEKWNNEHITEKALQHLGENPSRWENAPDQDVLNVLLANRVEWVDDKYNVLNSVVYGDTKSARIIHFVGPKPWIAWYIGEGNKAFDIEYYETMKRSKWNDVSLQQPVKSSEYRYMSKQAFKKRNLLRGIRWQIIYLMHKLVKDN